MKVIRTLSLAIALLIPVAAIASPTVRGAAACCPGECCPHCPFCPSGLHHK
jgi:hypothetical protein